MAYGDWSETTQKLLTGTPGTQISYGEIRAAIGNTTASISAREMHRVTDLDAPYDFQQGKYPSSTGAAHLPYVLDATENVGIGTSGALSPQDLRGVIKEYIIEQDSTSEEENFNVASLSSPSTVSIAASWNNNFNKNVTKYLRIKGRMISQDPTSPAVVTDAATSNLNIYVNNSSPSYGVYAAGGALGGQPGGHAIDIENPGAPAIRKVFVECEGSDSRIYAGGGGGVTGIDGFQGANGSGASTGTPGSPGSPGSGGSGGSGVDAKTENDL